MCNLSLHNWVKALLSDPVTKQSFDPVSETETKFFLQTLLVAFKRGTPLLCFFAIKRGTLNAQARVPNKTKFCF